MDCRSEAKRISCAWTKYCKDIGSMAFAQSNGADIQLLYQKVNEVGALNLRFATVQATGFDIEGVHFAGHEMPKIIKDDIDAHLRDWAELQTAKERRQDRDNKA